MALHFAPAALPGRARACPPIAKALAARAADRVANDNDGGKIHAGNSSTASKSASDQVLRAALRHFGQHGIGAAREARSMAEQAFFAGDRQAYEWWLGITRMLDRRLADEAQRLSSGLVAP